MGVLSQRILVANIGRLEQSNWHRQMFLSRRPGRLLTRLEKRGDNPVPQILNEC